MRSLGTSVGAAVVGVLLANTSVRFGPATMPSEAGFHAAFIVRGALALVAAILAALIPQRIVDAARALSIDEVPEMDRKLERV